VVQIHNTVDRWARDGGGTGKGYKVVANTDLPAQSYIQELEGITIPVTTKFQVNNSILVRSNNFISGNKISLSPGNF